MSLTRLSRHFVSRFARPRTCYGAAGGVRTLSSNGSGSSATKVEKIIQDTIKATGPISYSNYMQMCLSHPTEGYYMSEKHPVFGSKGDFVTSPEISQVFGEIIGIWFLSQYLLTFDSRPIRIVELGPGRGTLMADVLRVFSQFDRAKYALQEVRLIENSPNMKALQEKVVGDAIRKHDMSAALQWSDSIDTIARDENSFTMVLAHEFFDALPFHLLRKTDQGWQEVLIDSSPDHAAPTILTSSGTPASSTSSTSKPHFRQVLAPPSPGSMLLGLSSLRFQEMPVGSQIEVSPPAFKIAHQLGKLLATPEKYQDSSIGCALIVDYGDEKAFGNSFRAFRNHKIVDVFDSPGECDLTVNVDFAYLKEAIAHNGTISYSILVLISSNGDNISATPLGPLSQAEFLTRMGILMRVDMLNKAVSDEQHKKEIASAALRLIDPSGMGNQYKVLGISGVKEDRLSPELAFPFIDMAEEGEQKTDSNA
ncbi:DUF185-domain-containing protein [Panus rudis PR-1116 ss-1]|nr:DUF185-domain-containing protein [Panus rudis PR-1116 ss-1]